MIFCIFITKNLNLKIKTLLIIGSLIILFIRIFVLNYYEIFNSGHFIESLDFKNFNLFEKIKIISFYLPIYLTQVPIYLITLPILIYTSFKYKMKDITKFNLFFLILNLSFIYIAFLFKSTESELQIRFSMERILFQTSGFYFLAIVIFINNYLHSFNQKIFSSFKKKH